MRRIAPALAALVAMLAPAVPSAAAPAQAVWTVEVSGRAGEIASLRIPRTARLGNGGGDTAITSSAPWSGVAITRLDAPEGRDREDTYVHFGLRDALLCPGSHCEPPVWSQPTVAFADDGNGHAVLTAGRYGIALLGPAGAPVKATIRFRDARSGRTSLRTTGRPAQYTATTFDPFVEQEGSTLASRGFVRLDPKGRRVVTSLAVAFVLDLPGVAHHAFCVTVGGSREHDGTGGAVPCADHSGLDIVLGPDVTAVVPDGGPAVGIAHMSGAGLAENDFGLGYEAGVAGARGRVRAVHFAVVF